MSKPLTYLSLGAFLCAAGCGRTVQISSRTSPVVPETRLTSQTGQLYKIENGVLSLLDEHSSITNWHGCVEESSTVRTGSSSCLLSQNGAVYDPATPIDGRSYRAITFWMNSEKANGQEVFVGLTSPNVNGAGDYFFKRFSVDWTGWKLVTLRFADFLNSRAPKGFDAISRVTLSTTWGTPLLPDTRLIVDKVEFVESRLVLANASMASDTTGATVVAEPNRSGHGELRWTDASRGVPFTIEKAMSVPDDAVMQLCLHSQVANGQRVELRLISAGSHGENDYYSKQFEVDWAQSYLCAQLPFVTFKKVGTPVGFSKIDRVVFSAIQPKSDTLLTFDTVDIGLSRPVYPDTAKIDTSDVTIPSWNGTLIMPAVSQFQRTAARLSDAERRVLENSGRSGLKIPIYRKARTIEQLIVDNITTSTGIRKVVFDQCVGPYLSQLTNAQKALACEDYAIGWRLMGQLNRMAQSFLASNDESLRSSIATYVDAQLLEIASWNPLQRTGWTGNETDDGTWFGSSQVIRQIPALMQKMAGGISPATVTAIKSMLKREIQINKDTFANRLAWYWNNPRSNQFSIPSAAMAVSCLYLESECDRSAYEMAVLNLRRSLAAQGDSGSFSEGYSYGTMSDGPIFETISLLALAGDRRLLGTEHIRATGNWFTQLRMPGNFILSAFDSRAQTVSPYGTISEFLLQLLMMTDDPILNWGVRQSIASPSTGLFGASYDVKTDVGSRFSDWLGTHTSTGSLPPQSAFFKDQQLFVWRSSWQNWRDATTLWVRGQTHNDSHFHTDGGSVSLFKGDKVILTEAGTPAEYGIEDIRTSFTGYQGHNVLQIGTPLVPWTAPQISNASVPVVVRNTDDTGGSLSINGADMYADVKKWKRDLKWNRSVLIISDDAELYVTPSVSGDWFMFHTGALRDEDLVLQGSGTTWTATMPNTATMQLVGSVPMTVAKYRCKNGAIGKASSTDLFGYTTCIGIRAISPTRSLRLTTTIRLQ